MKKMKKNECMMQFTPSVYMVEDIFLYTHIKSRFLTPDRTVVLSSLVTH